MYQHGWNGDRTNMSTQKMSRQKSKKGGVHHVPEQAFQPIHMNRVVLSENPDPICLQLVLLSLTAMTKGTRNALKKITGMVEWTMKVCVQ